MQILENKVALVTGGTSGIGKQLRSRSAMQAQKSCFQADVSKKARKPLI